MRANTLTVFALGYAILGWVLGGIVFSILVWVFG
jgi:hypothetical protein